MSPKKQQLLVELHRRVRLAMDALRAVDRMLELEADKETSLSGPDELATRIREASRAQTRAKNQRH